jgi:hypothetical protein
LYKCPVHPNEGSIFHSIPVAGTAIHQQINS